jgi:K(+)-stimulated pyrophosphate-energized sodium pump
MQSVITGLWWIAPIASIFALIFAVYFYKKMMAAHEGNATMIEIAGHVREGAMAYLMRQYKVVIIVFVVLLIILQALAFAGIQTRSSRSPS